MTPLRKISVFLCLASFHLSLAFAKAPEHFYNPPEQLNPDPNYVPGEVALAEMGAAKMLYHSQKTQLGSLLETTGVPSLSTLGMGEISFSSIKNETATVLGYFRNYFGLVQLDEKGEFKRFDLLIDINSLDTGVPGRTNRILNIFFQSMKPEFGTAVLQFDQLSLGGKTLKDAREGESFEVQASGNLTLNGFTNPIVAHLVLKKQSSMWVVETKEAVALLISDFAFSERSYELLKECNHQSLGNAVKVDVKLYLK